MQLNLFHATTFVLCNYFLIAMGQKIVALEKNSCIKQVDNIHFSYNFFWCKYNIPQSSYFNAKMEIPKTPMLNDDDMMINELSKLNE